MHTDRLIISSTLAILFAMTAWIPVSVESTQNGDKDNVSQLQATTLATEELVEGATLSPDGADVAVLTSQNALPADDKEGQGTALIQIWSLNRKAVIAQMPLSGIDNQPHGKTNETETRLGEKFIRYTPDGKLLVAYDGENLRALRKSSVGLDKPAEPALVKLEEMKRIDLSLGPPRDNVLVQAMEVSPDGTHVAIAICNPLKNQGPRIRVYDLISGATLREWKFDTGCIFSGYSPLSWDSRGKSLAVSLPPYPGGTPHPFPLFLPKKKNVFILNMDSDNALVSMNTGYLAGPVCFTPDNTVITASLNADSLYFREDTIREWSVATGHLVREIKGPSQGVHTLLALSTDGSLILGYTGREKAVENFLDNVYLEFSLWDFRSGRLIATSGHIERPQPSNPREKELANGHASFGGGNEHMTMSGGGNKVLVWWRQSTKPFLIYDVLRQ